MARPRKEMSEASPKTTSVAFSRQSTAAERKEYMSKLEMEQARFAKSQQAFRQLRDVTKSVRQTTLSSFSKEDVIKYLQNIDSYEKELRGLSRYLFYRSQVYFRLIMYNATMFDFNARYVVPNYDLTKENDKDKILKSYYNTLKMLDTMDLQHNLLSPIINNFIEDVFYGCCWIDETGMFIYKIPPEYCKISGKYFTGDFSFSVDMSQYKRYKDIIEFLGEPLLSMYRAYGEDNKKKWQPMPDEFAICTKARVETWESIVPVYSGLFIDLIGLLNLGDIQAITDEQQIYKLIVATIPTLKNATSADEWAVNIDLAVDYYNKMISEVPDYIGGAISPIPLDTISFPDDQASDTTKVQKATKEVFNTSGGAQLLDSSNISGGEALRLSCKSDTELALSSLLGQYQGWVNRMLLYQASNPAKVKFFEISSYTKDAFKESMQKDLQYGFPNILAINSLNGFSEMDTLALNFLEQDVLGLTDKFKPLTSANTVSNKEGGAPIKSDTEITDDGAESRDKRDRSGE